MLSARAVLITLTYAHLCFVWFSFCIDNLLFKHRFTYTW